VSARSVFRFGRNARKNPASKNTGAAFAPCMAQQVTPARFSATMRHAQKKHDQRFPHS